MNAKQPSLLVAIASLAIGAVTTVAPRARADVPPLPPPPVTATTPRAEAVEAPAAPTDAGAAIPPDATASSSLKMTYEATRVDRATPSETKKNPDDATILHGFRIGYGYVMNYDEPVASFDGKSLKDKAGLRSPHHFLLGYEVVYRVVGHSWLNVLLLGNAMIAGIEQSKLLPSANALIGAELKNSFQIGVGANVSPLKGSEAHAIIAAGWTPRVGTIYTPVHFYFIPDVDGVNRLGLTTGVTF